MTTRAHLLERIVDLTADYRAEDGMVMDTAHVDRWIRQFPADVQEPMLAELGHVLDRTYLKKAEMVDILSNVAANPQITGGEHVRFWRNACVFDIQRVGNSQRDMLAVLDEVLQKSCGASLRDGGQGNMYDFVYIDDFLFSGGRITKDVTKWIRERAPAEARLDIITIVSHRSGEKDARKEINKAARYAGKRIDVEFTRFVEVEDRHPSNYDPDVLMPTGVPDDPATAAYVESLWGQRFRRPGQLGKLGLYSSEEGRSLLEQQFLMAGVRVLEKCPKLRKPNMRALGYDDRHYTGFGSMYVAYRNCPNNAPLALWAGAPWYPLFPRKTN